ncbi:hypothetical protein [Micromonospora sp. NBC_01796]|uniref:hypothetical protein n=1 Tax=Micromonospora sp. NBC_01796 TaxID=2975987 RepID=UPI002DDA55E1|nr:hypothetical protein [Micromonospora sp. NBC_01796]WSA89149.1 hypothetical protein OIE47_16970 [Micromonospora sp. NBC_01796]
MRHLSLARVACLPLVVATGLAAMLLAPTAAHAIPPSCDDPNPPPICFEDPDPVNHDPDGSILGARRVPGGVFVSGMASDPDGPNVTVTLRINNTIAGTLVANRPEPGLGNVGFAGVIPAVARGTSVCATAQNIGPGQSWPPVTRCRCEASLRASRGSVARRPMLLVPAQAATGQRSGNGRRRSRRRPC